MRRKLEKIFRFLNSGKKKIRVFLKIWLKKSFPSFSQWRQLFKILSKKEKALFLVFVFLFLSSAIFLSVKFYFKNTTIQPAQGGIYIEGLIGQPRLINPIYNIANDVDRDLVELLFAGLMKYNLEGKVIPDLAKECRILEEGKVYECYLKESLFWSDGKEFSIDDIIFTVKTIQNSDYKSPLFTSFLGVEVEKIQDRTIRFRLKNPYPPFLETLTFKILPKHIWENISSQNFPLTIYNLQPVGNGPFQLQAINQDKQGLINSLKLTRNPYYHGKPPYLAQILLYFFEKEEDLIRVGLKKEIKSLSVISPQNLSNFKERGFEVYHLYFPRYFDVTLNPVKAKILAEKELRQALNYGTDKGVILQEVLAGEGKIVYSPFLSEISGFPSPSKIYQFDLGKAQDILEKDGWQDLDQDGKREKIIKKGGATVFKLDLKLGSKGEEVKRLQECLAKDSEIYPEGKITGFFGAETKGAVIKFQEKYAKEILEPWGFKSGTGIVSNTTRKKLNELCSETPEEKLSLKFSLVTVDQEELSKVADLLKKQWQELGVDLEIKKVDLFTLQQDFLKPRNYEALLFGKVIGLIPDPYPFWHSSQKRDPGLNLAIYENKEADRVLEEARQALDEGERQEKYRKFQEILIEDAPVVFLYSPDYLYLVSQEVKGIAEGIIADPSKRFIDVENWYVKTKRVWK